MRGMIVHNERYLPVYTTNPRLPPELLVQLLEYALVTLRGMLP